jgi:hypothetical protein
MMFWLRVMDRMRSEWFPFGLGEILNRPGILKALEYSMKWAGVVLHEDEGLSPTPHNLQVFYRFDSLPALPPDPHFPLSRR